MSNDLECRKKEITVLVTEINVLRRDLALKGITEVDDEDRMEALDIIKRIERRILANMPAHQPTHEAAE